VEEDLKKIGVREWRTIVHNREDWKQDRDGDKNTSRVINASKIKNHIVSGLL
jgi:hypothetical protein